MMKIQRGNNVIVASEKIKGLLDLSHVHCDDAEEVIVLLFCGHRSVDKRKISVDDDIIICIVCKDNDSVDGYNDKDDGHDGSLENRRFPSKKH